MPQYTSVWEFRVAPGREAEFERHYNPDGTWARLFRRSDGYVETLLLKDHAKTLRYVTIDRWHSREQYRAFRAAFSREYAELDGRCAELTTHEASLGEFDEPFR